MSELLTSIVKDLEVLEPFASKTFTNKTDHESVTVWYTERHQCLLVIRRWHVAGPDTRLCSHHCLMDAALMIVKELEHII